MKGRCTCSTAPTSASASLHLQCPPRERCWAAAYVSLSHRPLGWARIPAPSSPLAPSSCSTACPPLAGREAGREGGKKTKKKGGQCVCVCVCVCVHVWLYYVHVHLRLVKVFITRKLNMIWKWSLHQSTSFSVTEGSRSSWLQILGNQLINCSLYTVIPGIFTLLIIVPLIFVVIYYSRFQ